MQAIFRLGGIFRSRDTEDLEHLRILEVLLTSLETFKASCYLLSTTGDPAEIRDALAHWDLARHFVCRNGELRVLVSQPLGEGESVKESLTRQSCPASCALYVDQLDDACQRVAKCNAGILIHSGRLAQTDCAGIIEHLHNQSALNGRVDRSASPHSTQPSRQYPHAIFDFDNTLTQIHVYNELVSMFDGAPNLDMVQTMPDDWWMASFGGQKRIGILSHMLGSLRGMGVKCYICSNNVTRVIADGLQRVGLLTYFLKSGNEIRIIPRGLPDKGIRVRENLRLHGGATATALFIDDDSKNLAKVAVANPGIGQMQCSAEGLTRRDCQAILLHFQNIVGHNGQHDKSKDAAAGCTEIAAVFSGTSKYYVGAAVNVRRTSGNWQSGQVSFVSSDGSVTVDLDDGLRKTISLDKQASLLKLSDCQLHNGIDAGPLLYSVGQEVEVKRTDGQWSAGRVTSVSIDGSVVVDCQGGFQKSISVGKRASHLKRAQEYSKAPCDMVAGKHLQDPGKVGSSRQMSTVTVK